ncbi:hypothetical protein [Absidia glauca]|uniref:Uncharacterized protein n=1 Tax=Absidia glauca TaxID=4829 RepID=A0A168KS19_ABSGL|nr:hypothetical protein [Absidia glauca]
MSAPLSPARIDEDLPSDFFPPGNLQVQVPERKHVQNLFNASFPGHTDMSSGGQAASTAHSVTEGFLIELKSVLSTNGVSG